MEKKTTEQLREEICNDFSWNEEDNKSEIDKVLGYKKDKYTAIQSKKKKDGDLKNMIKGKEFYKTEAKKATKTKKTDPKGETKKNLISADDKAYLFSKNIIKNRTEMRHLEKVMGDDKSWEKAIEDNMFKTFVTDNDATIKRRGSSLGASHGGSGESDETIHKGIVEDFSKDLPTGLAKKQK